MPPGTEATSSLVLDSICAITVSLEASFCFISRAASSAIFLVNIWFWIKISLEFFRWTKFRIKITGIMISQTVSCFGLIKENANLRAIICSLSSMILNLL